MSTIDYSRREAPNRHHDTNGRGELQREWGARTRIFLTPVAAPSILGLFGFAASTFIVAAFLAGWYGENQPAALILSNVAPFCLFFGGLAQFAAAMWAYRARDALATAMHGTWGAFWLGFGVFFTLLGAHVLHLATSSHGTQMVPYSYWFYTLAVITGCGFFAALLRNAGLSAVLFTLACGSACVAIGFSGGVQTWTHVGGYVLAASAALAVYTATALMLLESAGRVILPLGHFPYTKREHWAPGAVLARPQEYAEGMPGAKVGQ
jgi:succinate-acetate transporter protein